jgi:uncharacterized protein YfdQ (DUF2303 family)
MSAEENQTEASVVADLARAAVGAQQVRPGEVVAVPNGNGGVTIHDTDAYAETPRRTLANRTVTDAASFVRYIEKHGTEATEVWADTPKSTVIGVIDAPAGAERPSGWQTHRVTLSLEKSKPWVAWEQSDRAWFEQMDFADFIEDRASDVRDPEPATLLELAQSFQAAREVDFESSERMSDGQTRLDFKETITAKAGQKGHIEIPDRLQLALKPYIGGPAYWVTARFRYRLRGAQLRLGYVLERPQEILDLAFADIVAEIRHGRAGIEEQGQKTEVGTPIVTIQEGFAGITQPIFYGRP